MGYKDELLRRLQESGTLDSLPPQFREYVEEADDQFAQVILSGIDDFERQEVSDRLAISDPDSDSAKELAKRLIADGLQNVGSALDGKLLSGDGLTDLGNMLVAFILAAEAEGATMHEIQKAFFAIGNLESVLLLKWLGREPS